jgi:hypothetical protein
VVNPQFENSRPFEEGLAAVLVGKWGFIDKQGKTVITPQFDDIWLGSFKAGLASVQIGDYETGKRGFIDKQGKFVINPQFDYAFAFSERLAVIRVGDAKTGKWGYLGLQ